MLVDGSKEKEKEVPNKKFQRSTFKRQPCAKGAVNNEKQAGEVMKWQEGDEVMEIGDECVGATRKGDGGVQQEDEVSRTGRPALWEPMKLVSWNYRGLGNCRMDLPGPTTSVGTRTDYSVGPWDYPTCVARYLMA
jgi:hypothetical protein